MQWDSNIARSYEMSVTDDVQDASLSSVAITTSTTTTATTTSAIIASSSIQSNTFATGISGSQTAILPSSTSSCTAAAIADAFDIFDHSGNRTIDVRELGTVLRYLGEQIGYKISNIEPKKNTICIKIVEKQ